MRRRPPPRLLGAQPHPEFGGGGRRCSWAVDTNVVLIRLLILLLSLDHSVLLRGSEGLSLSKSKIDHAVPLALGFAELGLSSKRRVKVTAGLGCPGACLFVCRGGLTESTQAPLTLQLLPLNNFNFQPICDYVEVKQGEPFLPAPCHQIYTLGSYLSILEID